MLYSECGLPDIKLLRPSIKSKVETWIFQRNDDSIRIPNLCTIANPQSYDLGAASGFQALSLGLTLQPKSAFAAER
jgi:hypothetical protein